MGNLRRQPERDREIQKIENAISKLQIRIHQKKRELVTFTKDHEASIKKCTLKLDLKKAQVEALGKRPETPTSTTTEDADMDADPVPVERPIPDANSRPELDINLQLENLHIENELLVTIHGVKKSGTLVGRDLKKLVAWQMERHIQWAPLEKQRPWTTIPELCSILDIRTAEELSCNIPMGQGNLQLNPAYCRGLLFGTPWGSPAKWLLSHAKDWEDKPEEWILEPGPRAMLINLENWYFSLPPQHRFNVDSQMRNDTWDVSADLEVEWERMLTLHWCPEPSARKQHD